MDKVKIEWVDSRIAPPRWEFCDGLEPLEPLKCTTIGFLFSDASEYKTIVQTTSDNLVLGMISIPTNAITKIQKIREVKEKKK